MPPSDQRFPNAPSDRRQQSLIRLTRLGRRVTDPSTLEVNRTYKVKNCKFYATHALHMNHTGAYDYFRKSNHTRDMKYVGTRTLPLPGMGNLPVYQFMDVYGRLYELFWRWPLNMLKRLARRLLMPIPVLAGNRGIRLWRNVRPYLEYSNRLHRDMGRGL
jgi:hypothetical protein